MFFQCGKLSNLDLSNFKNSKNINIPSMFNQLISSFGLPNLNLPSEDIFSEFDLRFLFQMQDYLKLMLSREKEKDKSYTDLEIVYKPEEHNKENLDNIENKIRILGKKFILNNKNKCKIIYKETEYELKEYFEEIDPNYNNNDLIKLKLRINNNIEDISHMFEGCNNLISIAECKTNNENDFDRNHNSIDSLNPVSNKSEFGLSNENNSKNISLSSISSIQEKSSNFNSSMDRISKNNSSLSSISNITNMNSLFLGCSSLESLPDLSKLDLTQVTDLSYLFYECKSLKSLPDISGWKTSNVINMGYMFYKCNSLISLPDISKWNTSNVKHMNFMFSECNSLISLPDISKWNTSNVNNINNFFSGCNSLIALPNISSWITFNFINLDNLFLECNSLSSLPDISKWNTSNINDMNALFSGCNSLISLPDISKWNTSNVSNMCYMFSGCKSLISLPDISNGIHLMSLI